MFIKQNGCPSRTGDSAPGANEEDLPIAWQIPIFDPG